MTFQVPIHIPEDLSLTKTEAIRDEQITIYGGRRLRFRAGWLRFKTAHEKYCSESGSNPCYTRGCVLRMPQTPYKLYPLSDCKETDLRYSLQIVCPDGKMPYWFELTLTPVIPPEDSNYHAPINQTDTKNEEKR